MFIVCNIIVFYNSVQIPSLSWFFTGLTPYGFTRFCSLLSFLAYLTSYTYCFSFLFCIFCHCFSLFLLHYLAFHPLLLFCLYFGSQARIALGDCSCFCFFASFFVETSVMLLFGSITVLHNHFLTEMGFE